MNVVFKSILKDEFASFMEFIKLSMIDWTRYQRTLSVFDSFLYTEGLTEKKIEAWHIKRWLDGFNVSLSTKKGKLSKLKRFSDYLSTLGIRVSLPELPRKTKEFKPYVFLTDEMTQIFETADDYMLINPNSRIAAELPMLLRILYGCGLRIGEAISLRWDDIDMADGVITVKVAKNKKQRIVPMSNELNRILNLYKASPCFAPHDRGLLFKKENEQPRSRVAYGYIFRNILCELGIRNSQNTKHGRGPCIHSLRHTFTLHSLLKAEAEGRDFLENVPFLSTYLGHDELMHTDKYLKARHELYTNAHAVIADYTCDIFPKEV